MEITNSNLNDLLWELVSDKVSEIKEVSQMLKDIGYLDELEKIIASIDHSEVLEADHFKVIQRNSIDSSIQIIFEMNYILNTFEKNEPILRLTGSVMGECNISSLKVSELNLLNFSKMTRHELLNCRSFVELKNLSYSGIECDDLRTL